MYGRVFLKLLLVVTHLLDSFAYTQLISTTLYFFNNDPFLRFVNNTFAFFVFNL